MASRSSSAAWRHSTRKSSVGQGRDLSAGAIGVLQKLLSHGFVRDSGAWIKTGFGDRDFEGQALSVFVFNGG